MKIKIRLTKLQYKVLFDATNNGIFEDALEQNMPYNKFHGKHALPEGFEKHISTQIFCGMDSKFVAMPNTYPLEDEGNLVKFNMAHTDVITLYMMINEHILENALFQSEDMLSLYDDHCGDPENAENFIADLVYVIYAGIDEALDKKKKQKIERIDVKAFKTELKSLLKKYNL